MRGVLQIAIAGLCVLLVATESARAQGPVVSGSIAAADANSHTSPSYSGAVAWRFNRVFGLGVELTHTRALQRDAPSIYCCGPDAKARMTSFTTNVRLEIPTVSDRVVPFVLAGGGTAAVTSSYTVYYAQGLPLPVDLSALGLSSLPILPGPIRAENTSTNMMLTLGGGAGFLVSRHLSVDLDLRVMHVTGDAAGNIGRFGGGLSYRF